jgi:hypothetical protein
MVAAVKGMNNGSKIEQLGSVCALVTHKIRSIGASILLTIIIALLSYYLMPAQFNALLGSYQTQGQRAYAIAFIDLFLNNLFSSTLIVLALPAAFFLSLGLLRSWQDGLLAGLSTGILVSLLSIYILRTVFPQTLETDWPTTVLGILWVGIVNGLAIGLAGAAGGGITGRLISRRLHMGLASDEARREIRRCPKCGTEFESNPKFCSNCGRKIK